MSMTSEMSRIGAECESAQAVRIANVAAITSTLQRDLQKGRTARARAMAAQHRSSKGDLKEIFGAAAFLRGAAEDLVERFARDRDKKGDMLRDQLRSFVEELHETAEGQLERLCGARAASARREEAARRAYVKDMRRRVHAVLGHADTYIKGLHKDRIGAERLWEQHCRTAQRLRNAAASGDVAPSKRITKAKRARKTPRH